ncbi:MAG: AI-2E family transporter, partial [Aristaeellaceae bacterium]
GWLLLGLLMGVMELVPYIGPVLAGIPAVLLSLQSGWIQALWTLLVIWAVQQVEGSLLSPRLLSGATRLHPLTVLLAISAGGMLAGTLGMLLALPAVVSFRGALRGLRL